MTFFIRRRRLQRWWCKWRRRAPAAGICAVAERRGLFGRYQISLNCKRVCFCFLCCVHGRMLLVFYLVPTAQGVLFQEPNTSLNNPMLFLEVCSAASFKEPNVESHRLCIMQPKAALRPTVCDVRSRKCVGTQLSSGLAQLVKFTVTAPRPQQRSNSDR